VGVYSQQTHLRREKGGNRRNQFREKAFSYSGKKKKNYPMKKIKSLKRKNSPPLPGESPSQSRDREKKCRLGKGGKKMKKKTLRKESR